MVRSRTSYLTIENATKQNLHMLKNIRRALSSQRVLFIICSVAILIPYIVTYFQNSNFQYLPEGSIFSLNLGKYFADILKDGVNFFAGTTTSYLLNYIPFYFILWILEFVMSPFAAYLVFISSLSVLSFHTYTHLASHLLLNHTRCHSVLDIILIYIIGLLFYTSLSNFMFIQNNIAFLIPVLILPIQMEACYRFITKGKGLWSLSIANLFTIFNITHFLINISVILLFTILVIKNRHQKRKETLNMLLRIGLTLLIPTLLACQSYIISPLFSSSNYNPAIETTREDFYSINASILNNILQTNFWGFGGEFNGEKYYPFSEYYSQPLVQLVGLLPFLYLCVLVWEKPPKSKYHLIILVFMLFLLQLMLGMKNLWYELLYNNVAYFSIFRNITKFAPILLLSILAFILYKSTRESATNTQKITATAVLLISLIYNFPYISYSPSFFDGREFRNIPTYWYNCANYINTTMSSDDKILVLPATYINDSFLWNTKRVYTQGNLFDALISSNIKTYRLSEVLIGPPEFQTDTSKLFIPSDSTPRSKTVNYNLLIPLLNKYRINTIVVTKDLVSEYQKLADINLWIKNSPYKKIAEFDQIEIYYDETMQNDDIYSNNSTIRYRRINDNIYTAEVDLRSSTSVIYLNPIFGNGWTLYKVPSELIDQTDRAITVDVITSALVSHSEWAPQPQTTGSNIWELRKASTKIQSSNSFTILLIRKSYTYSMMINGLMGIIVFSGFMLFIKTKFKAASLRKSSCL